MGCNMLPRNSQHFFKLLKYVFRFLIRKAFKNIVTPGIDPGIMWAEQVLAPPVLQWQALISSRGRCRLEKKSGEWWQEKNRNGLCFRMSWPVKKVLSWIKVGKNYFILFLSPRIEIMKSFGYSVMESNLVNLSRQFASFHGRKNC